MLRCNRVVTVARLFGDFRLLIHIVLSLSSPLHTLVLVFLHPSLNLSRTFILSSTFHPRMATRASNSELRRCRPPTRPRRPCSPFINKSPSFYSNIACITTLGRPTSNPRSRSRWIGCCQCALCFGHRRAPRSSVLSNCSDRFIILLVRAVTTGSDIARRRHPDPRSHFFYLRPCSAPCLCRMFSSVNSPSLRTF